MTVVAAPGPDTPRPGAALQVSAALLTRAADAAEALAAGAPGALDELTAIVEALDGLLVSGPGTNIGALRGPLTRDELGDLLVTLAVAGLDADERTGLALRLADRLRAVGADLGPRPPGPAGAARAAPGPKPLARGCRSLPGV